MCRRSIKSTLTGPTIRIRLFSDAERWVGPRIYEVRMPYSGSLASIVAKTGAKLLDFGLAKLHANDGGTVFQQILICLQSRSASLEQVR